MLWWCCGAGHGYLYFPNGDIQECDYKSGRASGEGTLVTVAGVEMKGMPLHAMLLACMPTHHSHRILVREQAPG